MNIVLAVILGSVLTAVLFFMPFVGALIGATIAVYLVKKQMVFSLAIGTLIGVMGSILILFLYIAAPYILAHLISVNARPQIGAGGVVQFPSLNNFPQEQSIMGTINTIANLMILGVVLSVPGGVVGGILGGYLAKRRTGKDKSQTVQQPAT